MSDRQITVERTCPACGKQFLVERWRKPPRGQFCSKQCANSRGSRAKPHDEMYKTLCCEQCGKIFETLQKNIRRAPVRFCSIACARRSMSTPLSARLDKWTRRGTDEECWEWTGHKLPKGYGIITMRGTFILAHRAAWQVSNGQIPDDMCVCHKCDFPSCVNPKHLFLGTLNDNVQDMIQKGRNRLKITSSIAQYIRNMVPIKKVSQLAEELGVGEYAIRYTLTKRKSP